MISDCDFNFAKESTMEICTEGPVAHLQGDLTHSGVTDNIINLLAGSLQKIVSGGDKSIRIDCEKIHTADISGLQLLYVWMQSARIRGVEAQLINLSDSMRQSMQRMGFEHCFSGISTHPETPVFMYKQDKKFNESPRRKQRGICNLS
jgi:anti-anti-sigma regulatory factor